MMMPAQVAMIPRGMPKKQKKTTLSYYERKQLLQSIVDGVAVLHNRWGCVNSLTTSPPPCPTSWTQSIG